MSFCRQCTDYIEGIDEPCELAGLVDSNDEQAAGYCEGCKKMVWVDVDGMRIDPQAWEEPK